MACRLHDEAVQHDHCARASHAGVRRKVGVRAERGSFAKRTHSERISTAFRRPNMPILQRSRCRLDIRSEKVRSDSELRIGLASGALAQSKFSSTSAPSAASSRLPSSPIRPGMSPWPWSEWRCSSRSGSPRWRPSSRTSTERPWLMHGNVGLQIGLPFGLLSRFEPSRGESG